MADEPQDLEEATEEEAPSLAEELEEEGAGALEAAGISAPGTEREQIAKERERVDRGAAEAESKRQAAREKVEDLSREEKRAKIAQVLMRGVVNHRLRLDFLPDHLAGVWARNRPEDIDYYRSLGFRVEREAIPDEVRERYEHDQGDGKLVVGDTVLMTIHREDFELIEEVRDQDKKRRLRRGEQEYTERAKSDPNIPIIDRSHSH